MGQSCPLLPGQLINSLQIASNYHSHFCVYNFPPSRFCCSFSSYLGNYPFRRITWGYHIPNTNVGPIWNLTGLMQWSFTHRYVFIPFLHPGQRRTSDRARHFTTAQMFSVSQVTGSCLKKKSSRTALACPAPKRSDLTSDTRVTDLASDPKNVNKWVGWILAFECL